MRHLLFAACLLLLGGCANLGYYLQTVHGQLDIWNQEQPISKVMDDPRTPPVLRHKLAVLLAAREFAQTELGLSAGGSYRTYVDLKTPYVTWNVFAAPEFSTKLKKWCFPVAGCVDYRGYFSKAGAVAEAKSLAQRGYDVYVGGAIAYSTLGWFDDPVLSSLLLESSDTQIAATLFHELAHRRVYAPNDSTFNESFATTVENEGARRWLAHIRSPELRARYARSHARDAQFVALVNGYRARLKALYASPLDADVKRARKAALFAALKTDYARLKQRWGGYGGYDRWFAHDLNNAQLGSLATYTTLIPAFKALLRRANGNLPDFYRAVQTLAALPKEERRVVLEGYMPKTAPPAVAKK